VNIRLTGLGDEEVLVQGASADPPIEGQVFSVLVMSHNKLVVTGQVDRVGFFDFCTVEGTRYVWARVVGEA
jgi:hypothetical protein